MLRLRPEAQPEETGLSFTAITADAGGNKVAELRYTAFGDTWGSTPPAGNTSGKVRAQRRCASTPPDP